LRLDRFLTARWWPVALLAVAALGLRFPSLGSKPFWFDECFSAEIARISWGNFLHLLWWREANMSFYYLLLRLWMYFGQSPFFIRTLSVLIGAATVPPVYWVGRQLYDRRTAWVAAVLFTFNAYSVRYSQEARSYALFVLLATLSSGFLVATLRHPVPRNRIAYVVVSILAVYAHFYALLLIAAHWLALRRFGGDPTEAPAASRLMRTWKPIGIAVLPLLIFVAKTGAGPLRWIQRPTFDDLFRFCENLSGGTSWPLPLIYAVASLAAVAAVGRGLWQRGQIWETWRVQFLGMWLAFPVLLTILLSFARPVFLARYMIFCLPALVILVAAGLVRVRRSTVLVPVLVGILLLSCRGILFVYGHDFDTERDASGAATNFILDHSQRGDAIVFHIAETRGAYEFFRTIRAGEDTASPRFTKPLGPEILFPRHGSGLDYHDFTGKPTPELLRSAADTHARLWVMLMYNSTAGRLDATTEMLDRVLPAVYPKHQCREFYKVEVCLYNKPDTRPAAAPAETEKPPSP